MINPTLSSVQNARDVLAIHFSPSRLVEAAYLSKVSGKSVFLKLETELPTGSFKIRGALYTLSVRLRRSSIREVVASSTGNHGAAVAYAARMLGVRAKIFLPEGCNPVSGPASLLMEPR
jgi:threonine dehydratase